MQFMIFWNVANFARTQAGLAELNHGEARDLYASFLEAQDIAATRAILARANRHA